MASIVRDNPSELTLFLSAISKEKQLYSILSPQPNYTEKYGLRSGTCIHYPLWFLVARAFAVTSEIPAPSATARRLTMCNPLFSRIEA